MRLTATVQDDLLHVVVEDDGVGMAQADIAGHLAPEEHETDHLEGGIGLRNCHFRLVQLYGPQHGLQVQSRPGQGTKVTLSIPRAISAMADSETVPEAAA